jgi:hypothetical protein
MTAVDLHLDAAQADLLRELLSIDARDLRFEIADTDNFGYKQSLRQRDMVLRSILDQLGGELPVR